MLRSDDLYMPITTPVLDVVFKHGDPEFTRIKPFLVLATHAECFTCFGCVQLLERGSRMRTALASWRIVRCQCSMRHLTEFKRRSLLRAPVSVDERPCPLLTTPFVRTALGCTQQS